MLEAKIHKEITEYEGKIFFGMTGKQIICILISCVIVVPLFLLLYDKIGVEVTGYICIIVALPILAFGFFKYKGRTFMEMIKLLFNFYIKNSKLHCVNMCATDYLEKDVTENDRKRNRDNRKVNPKYEYVEFRYTAGTKKQIKQKRKEIRKHLATAETKYVYEQKQG